MNFHILTIFPDIFDSYTNESILKRAQKAGIIKIETHNLRDWTTDNHKTVDDTPYGGGAGMVMKAGPIYKAINDIKSQITNSPLIKGAGGILPGIRTPLDPPLSGGQQQKTKIVLLSAKGKTWNQQMAKKYSKLDNVVFVCGRYEGVDERVKKFIDEEVSIGDYVLTGGELGALVLIDSITRLLPGALGNAESAISESHTTPGVLEYPQYTRPEVFETEGKKLKVPKVLLSGNHAEIEKWRTEHSPKQHK